jgi:hypothetical protein
MQLVAYAKMVRELRDGAHCAPSLRKAGPVHRVVYAIGRPDEMRSSVTLTRFRGISVRCLGPVCKFHNSLKGR